MPLLRSLAGPWMISGAINMALLTELGEWAALCGRSSPISRHDLAPAAARWDGELGLYVLDWDDARRAPDPHAAALEFAASAVHHACVICGWDPELADSALGTPPPVH